LAWPPDPRAGRLNEFSRRGRFPAVGFVMRYRSATVAGSHGLPCVSETDAKNQTLRYE